MTNFTTIGFAKDTKKKNGDPAIVLSLDPKSRKEIFDHDYQEKIWLFPSNYGYVVMAPMKDGYKFEKPVRKNEQTKLV